MIRLMYRGVSNTPEQRGAHNPRRLLTLYEASRLSDIAIYALKRAISEGHLRAVWHGRYYVCRADLGEFLHGL